MALFSKISDFIRKMINLHKKMMKPGLSIYRAGFFYTKKVTPIIGIFPSANFPQEKYFSPSNQFFLKKPIFPSLKQYCKAL